MDDETQLPFGWWGYQPSSGTRRSVVDLIASGTLDPELASLLWILVEGRVSVLVGSGLQSAGKTTLLTALLDFLPRTVRRIGLLGRSEQFDWLPEAAALGWRAPAAAGSPSTGSGGGPGGLGADPADPASSYLLAPELSDHLPQYLWGEQAKVALRAVSRGFGLGTTIHADSLEEVFALLQGPSIGVTDDEVSRLGVVLILGVVGRAPDGQWIRRVLAAHLVRPVMRDQGGHIQRPGPAVLATWQRPTDRFDHFAWGIAPELAERVGLSAQEFGQEQADRRAVLADLAARGVTDVEQVRRTIRAYQASHPVAPGRVVAPAPQP